MTAAHKGLVIVQNQVGLGATAIVPIDDKPKGLSEDKPAVLEIPQPAQLTAE